MLFARKWGGSQEGTRPSDVVLSPQTAHLSSERWVWASRSAWPCLTGPQRATSLLAAQEPDATTPQQWQLQVPGLSVLPLFPKGCKGAACGQRCVLHGGVLVTPSRRLCYLWPVGQMVTQEKRSWKVTRGRPLPGELSKTLLLFHFPGRFGAKTSSKWLNHDIFTMRSKRSEFARPWEKSQTNGKSINAGNSDQGTLKNNDNKTFSSLTVR